MGNGTIREDREFHQGTTSSNLEARDHDTFHCRERERDPLCVSLLAMRQDDFPAPQDFSTGRDGPTTTPTSSPWTPWADSFEAPLASSTPASRSGAAPKFQRDERVAAPPRAATWVILACVPSVSSSDDDFMVGYHLAFDWRDPPGVSLHTLRQSISVSPAPQDFCPDRDDHPYVVAVDSAGGLLLRGARRRAHDFGPGVALGFDPAPCCANDGGYILCHATLRMAFLYPPSSDEYRLLCAGNVRREPDGDHPIRLLAELQIEPGNGIHRATLLLNPQELRVSASKEANAPTSRRPGSSDGVVALAGKLPFTSRPSQACGSYSRRGHDDRDAHQERIPVLVKATDPYEASFQQAVR
uniref:DUF1618 domain-containing protein n=1 Tax=Oryza glumipatula TaxID=40148 RepID=A0A0D9Y603_9ORYZ